MLADIQAHLEHVVSEVQDAADTAAREGELVMKEIIDMRGTGRDWSHTYFKNGIPRDASKPGRVWTGNMLNSVKSRTERSKYHSKSSFGWLDVKDEYFLQQELGFEHSSGIIVEGMNALGDAYDEAISELLRKLKTIK